jgi:hypothetical protein
MQPVHKRAEIFRIQRIAIRISYPGTIQRAGIVIKAYGNLTIGIDIAGVEQAQQALVVHVGLSQQFFDLAELYIQGAVVEINPP